MKPLKYGINKVPESGIIEMYPDRPIRIRLPERPMEEKLEENVYQEPVKPAPTMRSEALRSIIYKNTLDPNSVIMGDELNDADSLKPVNNNDEYSDFYESLKGMSDEDANAALDEHIKNLKREQRQLKYNEDF